MDKEINVNKTGVLLENIIKKNAKAGSQLRQRAVELSRGQQEILIAAENIERAMDLLQKAQQELEAHSVILTQREIDEVAAYAASLMPDDPDKHYHCAEAFTIAVGEHFFGRIDNRVRRMTTGFSGGVGGTHEEMCGALFGGILMIGAIYGRAWPNESDEICYKKSVAYRQQFMESFGGSSCQSIKDTGYGSQGIYPCSVFVEKAVKLFFNVLLKD